jgi:hypothetical protein
VNAIENTPEKAFLLKYRTDEEARSQLSAFLAESSLLTHDCHSELSAQVSKWLKAMKVRIADKNHGWRDSWEGRYEIVVLDFSKESSWPLQLYAQLGFPAQSKVCCRMIDCHMKKSVRAYVIR